jgi:S-adenosylmethionine decarboxylase
MENTHYSTKGVHIVADLWECDAQALNNEAYLKTLLHESARAANMHVVGETSHTFTPQGVTSILLLEESHISIHTYPEVHYAAVDIYTCGTDSQPQKALDMIVKSLHTQKANTKIINRGE